MRPASVASNRSTPSASVASVRKSARRCMGLALAQGGRGRYPRERAQGAGRTIAGWEMKVKPDPVQSASPGGAKADFVAEGLCKRLLRPRGGWGIRGNVQY